MIIYKYSIEGEGSQYILPSDSAVLSAGLQDNKPVVWMLHRTLPSDDTNNRLFMFSDIFTGEDFYAPHAEHVATLTDSHGLVHHIFSEAGVEVREIDG